jgi:hypothetical protein
MYVYMCTHYSHMQPSPRAHGYTLYTSRISIFSLVYTYIRVVYIVYSSVQEHALFPRIYLYTICLYIYIYAYILIYDILICDILVFICKCAILLYVYAYTPLYTIYLYTCIYPLHTLYHPTHSIPAS